MSLFFLNFSKNTLASKIFNGQPGFTVKDGYKVNMNRNDDGTIEMVFEGPGFKDGKLSINNNTLGSTLAAGGELVHELPSLAKLQNENLQDMGIFAAEDFTDDGELKPGVSLDEEFMITDADGNVEYETVVSADGMTQQNIIKWDENKFNNKIFNTWKILDEKYNMGFVSGAVPDDFTTEGQIWNTALYDWEEHLKQNYEYWINKLKSNLDKVDYLRIDHFVGFFQYWAIPIKESALNGSWRKGPWKTFFKEVSKEIPMSKLVAEDLGVVLSETEEILSKYNIPGMKVLQQRIPSDIIHDEIHPNEWKENLIAYTGTHDSPTIKQWFGESNEMQIQYFNEYRKELNFKLSNDVWDFISLVWESPAQVSVTTVQDLLELDKEARFNSPGTKTGNWGWRLKEMDQLNSSIKNLKLLNEMNSRNI